MHNLVEHFSENITKYNESYFAGFVLREGDNRKITDWRLTEAVKGLYKIAKLGEKPFDNIMNHLNEMDVNDLNYLVDNMPSGWERAVIMEKIALRTNIT